MKNAWQVRLILLFPVKTAHAKMAKENRKTYKIQHFMNCIGKRYTPVDG